ncbi:hypothetical protein PIROE2DRAFT_64529 [Piromyces sp. E2]|nr:hypothetical protein PIROE2DRAFT_64529 [Piromyces sp. E2]|eukprot:OUM58261.1 hypothetical protein PIROE2DRAFT_64529 [Piromyces sp. E2]
MNTDKKEYEDIIEDILELLKQNDIKEIEKYSKEHNISLNELYKEDFDILIRSIEMNVSLDIINYIIVQSKYETLNYQIIEENKVKTPLLIALENQNFKIAKVLLKHKADINYANGIILNNLYSQELLNTKNLKFILRSGFDVEAIKPTLIYSLIEKGQNDFLEIILKYFKYNNSFILDFLNLYKNKTLTGETSIDYEEIILKEKNKIEIDETMYEKALAKGNYDALRILFENESSEEEEIIYRIIKYDLLENSVKTSNYSFVENILLYKQFNNKCIHYEKILSEANNNNIEIAQLLIQVFIFSSSFEGSEYYELSLNKYDNRYFSLLLNLMIKMNNITLVRYLVEDDSLKSNMNLNVSDIKGEYPIIKAFYSENFEVFKYLIEHGADCNTKNKNGVSLLWLAIHKNKMDIIKYLIKHHVDITVKDSNGNTPLMKAVYQNNTEIVKLIINYSLKNKINLDITEKDTNGNSPLINAVNHNNTAIVKLLIYYCNKRRITININEKDINGNPLLIKAIHQNNFDSVISIVNYGINHNIDMNLLDVDGNTPLTISYEKGYIKIFKYLVEFLDINQRDSRGNSVLYYVIDKGDIEMMKELINIGADINLKCSFDESAIDRAIFKGNVEILELLLENDNLLLNKINILGKTPLISVINEDNYTVEQKESIIETFIEKGANINMVCSKDGNSPLMYAYQAGYLSIVELLIYNGADINIKNKEGNSLLVYAIKNNDFPLVKYLTENGADVNIKNNEGKSPLHYAINTDDQNITDYLYCYMNIVLKSMVFRRSFGKIKLINNNINTNINNVNQSSIIKTDNNLMA